MNRWTVLLCVLLSACGSAERGLLPPIPSFDASTDVARVRDSCTSITDDFFNCGLCGYVCDPSNADNCTNSTCQCGTNIACGVGEDCRNGRCVPRDDSGKSCEFDDECLAGYACIEGACSFVTCVPEECDGYDNDCDGEVDNAAPGVPLAQYCVGDSPAIVGAFSAPCSVGVRLCALGAWGSCAGDVPPIPEVGFLACDGVDNDCNGCIDGEYDPVTLVCRSNPPSLFDVVFVIDVSSSMGDSISIVTAAVGVFAGRLDSPAIRYAVVEIPGDPLPDAIVTLDLSDLASLQAYLSMSIRTRGSVEPQIDAIYDLGTEALPISWRPGAVRIIIVFTDERPQSVRRISEEEMCASLTRGEALVIVTENDYAEGLGGPPGPECAWDVLDLPRGNPGTGDPCSVDSDCDGSFYVESCFAAQCFTDTVVDTVIGLETVITDPCGG